MGKPVLVLPHGVFGEIVKKHKRPDHVSDVKNYGCKFLVRSGRPDGTTLENYHRNGELCRECGLQRGPCSPKHREHYAKAELALVGHVMAS